MIFHFPISALFEPFFCEGLILRKIKRKSVYNPLIFFIALSSLLPTQSSLFKMQVKRQLSFLWTAPIFMANHFDGEQETVQIPLVSFSQQI